MYANNLVLGNYFDTGLEGRNECTLTFRYMEILWRKWGFIFLVTSEIQKWGLLGFYAFFIHHSIFVMVIVGFVNHFILLEKNIEKSEVDWLNQGRGCECSN